MIDYANISRTDHDRIGEEYPVSLSSPHKGRFDNGY
jgi:hypothetical protein